MDVYGDESGHLNGVLHGESRRFVLAVIAGEPVDTVRCAKRAVRNVRDLGEARWNDLTRVQKRRVFDCFAELSDALRFAYLTIERADLTALECNHLLFQDDSLEYDADLTVMGIGYTKLIRAVTPPTHPRVSFTFDRIFGKKQSEQIRTIVRNRIGSADVTHGSSRQYSGIQAADCFAGAVAGHRSGGTDWLSMLPDGAVTCATVPALDEIETYLRECDTGP